MAKETEVKKDPFLAALEEVNKKYGAGSVLSGNDVVATDRMSTGSLWLDVITGGGWGVGRMVELVGPESVGKSSVCIQSAVAAQKQFPDRKVVIIDTEHALDRKYCMALGLDMNNVFVSQPDSGEEALEILEKLISTGKVSLAIVDSIAALVPKKEIDGEMGDSQMGAQGKLMSQACRKLVGLTNVNKSTILWTNQIRNKIGVMFGSPETSPGGLAMKYYASIRVDMRKAMGDKIGDEVQNIKVTCKTIKNKLAPPFKKCEFTIGFGKGIDKIGEVFSIAVATGLIKRGGSWFSYGDTKLGQGEVAAKELLKDNPDLVEILEKIIRENISVYDDIEQVTE
jgi:recombination protein RecA